LRGRVRRCVVGGYVIGVVHPPVPSIIVAPVPVAPCRSAAVAARTARG
jgi:hypothetical protein